MKSPVAALHRFAMQAYPPAFRERLGDDLQDTYLRRVEAARHRSFVRGLVAVSAGLIDTCLSGLAERSADRRVRLRYQAQLSDLPAGAWTLVLSAQRDGAAVFDTRSRVMLKD